MMSSSNDHKKQAPLGSSQFLIGDSRSAIFNLPVAPKCIITSPPYFNVRKYPAADQIGYGQSLEEFLRDIAIVFGALHLKAARGAALWIVADSIRQNGRLLHLPALFVDTASSAGWQLQSTLVWLKDRTYPWAEKGRLRKLHELILLFTKGDPASLDVDRIREVDGVTEWWLRYPERYNPLGRSPGDVWFHPIPIQGSWGKGFLRHECPFPAQLVERIIEMSTKPGDLVLDPFAGTGIVAAVAHEMGRVGLAIDVSAKFKEHFDHDVKRVVSQWWSAREIERAEASQQRQAFFRANVGLRVAKLGRVIANRLIDSRVPVVGCWLQVSRPRRKIPWASVELTVLLTRGDPRAAVTLTQGFLKKPPLSKFGLDVKVKATHLARFKTRARGVVYSDSVQSGPEVSATEFRKMCQAATEPLVSSNFPVSLDDIRRVNTKYWRDRRPPSFLRDESLEFVADSGQLGLWETP